MHKIVDFLKYIFYKRVITCFLMALAFTSCVFLLTIILSVNSIGVDFETLSGGHTYKVSNPITIVSFAATFVTISLTILGFALNNFSKRSKGASENIILGNSIYEEAVGILLVRYRRKKTTLIFFNVLNFPLLGKAFVLVLLLGCMFCHCFIGEYRMFYLIVYATLMFVVIVSMLICVFEIYSDINFTFYRACRIILSKIKNRLDYLLETNGNKPWSGLRQVLRRYARIDIFRAIVFLKDTSEQLLYRPAILTLPLLSNIPGKHYLSELILCLDLSPEMMHGIVKNKENKEQNNRNTPIIDYFDFFLKNFVKNFESLVKDLKNEIMYVSNLSSGDYYFDSKDKILNKLNYFYDKIKSEEEKNAK